MLGCLRWEFGTLMFYGDLIICGDARAGGVENRVLAKIAEKYDPRYFGGYRRKYWKPNGRQIEHVQGFTLRFFSSP